MSSLDFYLLVNTKHLYKFFLKILLKKTLYLAKVLLKKTLISV